MESINRSTILRRLFSIQLFLYASAGDSGCRDDLHVAVAGDDRFLKAALRGVGGV